MPLIHRDHYLEPFRVSQPRKKQRIKDRFARLARGLCDL